jgi:hypothetical protein
MTSVSVPPVSTPITGPAWAAPINRQSGRGSVRNRWAIVACIAIPTAIASTLRDLNVETLQSVEHRLGGQR